MHTTIFSEYLNKYLLHNDKHINSTFLYYILHVKFIEYVWYKKYDNKVLGKRIFEKNESSPVALHPQPVFWVKKIYP